MLPRRRFLSQSCVLSALGLPSACATPNSASGPGPVSVSFDAAIPGPVIDPHFLGLSYEKDRIWRRLFDVADTGLVGLFRALGQGVLRIGGNSVDKTVWRADGPGRQAGFVARPDIDRLAGFVRATGWQIIYAVNMGGSSPTAAADEAADAARAFGPALLGLEIGNEPDVYRHNGLRPASYSYGPFQREWQDFATAIRARTPDIVLTGPATAGDEAGFTVPFASDHGAEIALLTQHYYRANGRNTSSTIDL